MTQKQQPQQIFHALPLRDVVIFPQMTTTILVGREKSVNSIEEARRLGVPVLAVTQTNPDLDEFDEKNIHRTGTLCSIIEATRTADGTFKVILQGLVRARIKKVSITNKFFTCEADLILEQKIVTDSNEDLGLIKACIDNFNKYAAYNKRITPEILASIAKLRAPHEVIYMIATYSGGSLSNKQKILEEDDIIQKFYKLLEVLKSEIEIGQAEERINKSIQEKFTKHQKEVYLNEQIKNIKKELGQDEEAETKELREKLAKLKLPKEVRIKCDSELKKLEKMNPYASESGVVRNYLEWICSLPWTKKSALSPDLIAAKKVLDKHHYGLEKIKERILEFIAVQMKTKDSKGPILCLVGAPGVGKTSLAKSIAESLGRKYVKVSLGGVRDESEIRGHRRTYIGSMPGRIIQSMRKVEKINPLMLLDEIDKMSHDFRGDPASALLEVLDPEQNNHFSDHYLEVDYDLSKVMFVATANSISTIPIPLRDRMEIIKLSGYTENEKLNIAKEHLIAKQRKENGLTSSEFSISDDAILTLIRRYTFEAGVRNLSREISNLARKTAKVIVMKEAKSLHITEKNLRKYAGIEKKHFGIARDSDLIGITTGLAYTEYGGDLLDIEALKFEGSGKIQVTGRLGEVMKESAQAALSYTRSIAKQFKIDAKKFNKYDFHIHVPEGATPKDGPSAGVALCVSLVSVLSEKPVRKDVAMTGEITLSGKVLEIGGLKEKLLAALRGQIKTVLIPEANTKDLEEMPKEVLDNLKIKPISHVSEALEECLRLPKTRKNV
ncbi:MAG: endopeptidase La [Proteobacteria bacterium]|nr:endopeptidase La [Pseudomonadota bacterium]